MIARKKWAARGRTLTALASVPLLVVATAGIASADDISNNLDATVDAVAEVMPLNVGGGNGTTQLYVTPRNGDGKNGCNLTGSTTLALSVSSSNTAFATVSPSTVTFTSCEDTKTLTVTPVSQGTATVSVSQTSNTTDGSFNLAPASFTVNVAPPANTAPAISVLGVTGGTNYDKGSVPAATCSVTDAEDGPSSFAATLSAVTGPYASDGIGSQTASCSYTDGGGLKAEASETYTIGDPSGPVISYALSPAAPDGANGWYKGNVTLAWTVTDLQSPNSVQKTGCVDQNITADQAATTYTCSATSAGGSAAEQSVTIKRDGTAPTISSNLSSVGTENAAGWYNQPVTVSFTCNDGLSGIDTCTPNSVLGEGADQSVTGTAKDMAGNTASTTESDIDIDLTAPVITDDSVNHAPTGTLGTNGWFRSDVTVTFGASDNLSGFTDEANPYTFTRTTSGEGSAVTVGSGTVNDAAGNTSNSVTSQAFKIDKTAPNAPSGASLDPAPNAHGWNNSNVVVSFTSAGDPGIGSSGVYNCTTKTVSLEAVQSVSGTCTDNAGNVSEATQVTVQLDKTAPVITETNVSGTLGTNGWYKTPVTVTYNAADNLSGFDGLANPYTFTRTTSGEGLAVTAHSGTVDDLAGNTSNEVFRSFNVDTVAPATPTWVGGPAAGSSHVFGSVPAEPTCTSSDATSGLKDCVVTGYSALVGTHIMTATATDNAGHETKVYRTYTVLAWNLSGFFSPVDMGGVLNTVKGGSTVPLKFELFAGSTELTSTSAITSFKTAKVSCTTGAGTEDAIEIVSTGGTSLRYDTTGGQFIQNWKTPTGAGSCYSATMTAADGSSITALFKIK